MRGEWICGGGSCRECARCLSSDPPPGVPGLEFPDRRARSPALLRDLFQFCEILSTPEVSRWAGPIIDVLLDYVGNVQLCSRLKEHIDSFEDWAVIKEKAGRGCRCCYGQLTLSDSGPGLGACDCY